MSSSIADPTAIQARSGPYQAATEPFLKWAGGKRWALPVLQKLVPPNYKRYIEPFLGGGSLFFSLGCNDAVLSDVNFELINAYRTVRDNHEQLDRWLAVFQKWHNPELYYKIRSRDHGSKFWSALRFIYLNRTCFNGIYRVNLKGKFNVPIGTKDRISYPDGLRTYAAALCNVTIKHADFQSILRYAKSGDFVYVDPPYTVKHNNNGFIKYNEHLFKWSDQIRLRDEIRRAQDRGAYIVVSNAAHDSIFELYKNVGEIIRVERSSVLAAAPNFRRRELEVVIKCY
ncbi:DNA adenine methylase [Sphingomonas ursincola]|uniref:DNA adenine methylase n=1 Tax=Sphingomonas ursincola TaxID=56361 RepID=UPI001884DA2A|nr:Dam family site-specific DNA-(adenine-N6)-methyltransferase [Sphingomonas ursincola]